VATIHDCLGELVYGENGVSLEQVVVGQLQTMGKSISISDFGLNGAVAQAIDSADELENVLAHSVTGVVDKSAASIRELASAFSGKSDSDWAVVISSINRDEAAIKERSSVYSVAIASRSGDVIEKEFFYSGHSGWRETRAVKEVLNFVRLHLIESA
jgi:nicotinamide mononucleotide (NMN) deamidase PncC